MSFKQRFIVGSIITVAVVALAIPVGVVVAELPCLYPTGDASSGLLAKAVALILPTAHACGAGTGGGIQPPPRSITVKVPNGGETWYLRQPRDILWSSVRINGNVKIELSRDGGVTYTALFASTPNDGVEQWTVAGNLTTKGRIRITSIDNTNLKDTSNADFSIANPCDAAAPSDQCWWFFWTQRRWALGAGGAARVVDYWIKCNSIPANLDQQVAIDAINRAFATWNNQTVEKLRYNYRGCNNAVPGGWREDGINVISFAPWDSLGETKFFYDGTLPLPKDQFGKEYLTNTEFDIILDSTPPPAGTRWVVALEGTFLVGEVEVENVMAHEVGHSLGLDHLTVDDRGNDMKGASKLTMRYSTNEINITIRQSLGRGDIDGAKCIYFKAIGPDCKVGLNQ